VDQIGHALQRIIHTFPEATEKDKIFMAKFDIKDGFWRMDCYEGEEWNFSYVLPQPPGEPIRIVVPTSLQMGWIKSPAFFCAATETGRDIIMQYTNTPISSLPEHKFEHHSLGCPTAAALPHSSEQAQWYLTKVYVDNFMSNVVPYSQ
jgi:hypothetical protein